MSDIVDYMYTSLLHLNNSLKEKALGKFSERPCGEPDVWHGVHMHAFYEIFSNLEKELYVRGNIKMSTESKMFVDAKLILTEDRIKAEKRCSYLRKQHFLFCETVEEISVSIFGTNFDIKNFIIQYEVQGKNVLIYREDETLKAILREFPEINS